jgi:hypothetical protein
LKFSKPLVVFESAEKSLELVDFPERLEEEEVFSSLSPFLPIDDTRTVNE